MFAPNTSPNFHHRGPHFHKLYRSIEEKFLTLAGLSQDWELYLVTGSGTTGIEAVIASATQWVETLFVEPQSDFSVRLSDMVSEYNLCYLHAGDNVAYVQYETSRSLLNLTDSKAGGVTIVDAVSAFPYYQPPVDADILVTVSGKQLGAQPGVALVAVHNRVWEMDFLKTFHSRSCLSLQRYRNSRLVWETPFTPALAVLESLDAALDNFDVVALRSAVDSRFAALVELGFPSAGQSPPVFTFPRRLSMHDQYELYGKEVTQLFLWDRSPGADQRFDSLLTLLRKEKV